MRGTPKLGLRGKLVAMLVAFLALLAVVGFVGIWIPTGSRAAPERFYDNQLTGARKLADAQNSLWQLRYGFPQFMVLTGEDQAAIPGGRARPRRRGREVHGLLPGEAAPGQTSMRCSRPGTTRGRATLRARPLWFELQGAGKVEEAAGCTAPRPRPRSARRRWRTLFRAGRGRGGASQRPSVAPARTWAAVIAAAPGRAL